MTDRRFALLMNRYAWETDEKGARHGVRKRTGLHFDGVTAVRSLTDSMANQARLAAE